jgi:hypothetical protein
MEVVSREAMEGFRCREEGERLWAARERAGIVAGRRKPAGAKEQKGQDIACHVACFQWLLSVLLGLLQFVQTQLM